MAPPPGVRTRLPVLRAAYPTLFALLAAACAGGAPPASAPLPELEARVNAAPADAGAALRLGIAYRAAERSEDARVLLERATANLPGESRLVLLLGLTYEDLGRFPEARRLYERYIDAPSARLRTQARERLAVLDRAELRAAARDALARESELTRVAPSASTLAVFPFQVETRDTTLRPLGRALAEMLSTDLSQTPRLTVLERSRVQALLDEASLGRGVTEPSSAVRAGRLLSAGTVIQGRVSGVGTLRLDALLAAANGDGSGPTVSREGALARLLDEEKELALRLYDALGVELTPAERERVSRRMTQNVQALLVFGSALEAEDAGQFQRAAELFRRASALDQGFSIARLRAVRASAAAEAISTAAVANLLLQPEIQGVSLEPEDLAPLPIGREPTSEALGTEGFARPRTTVDVIIIRP
jgi:tetratricopeptide (TPR) repeat protein